MHPAHQVLIRRQEAELVAKTRSRAEERAEARSQRRDQAEASQMFPARYYISHVHTLSRPLLLLRPVLLVPHIVLLTMRIVAITPILLWLWCNAIVTGRVQVGSWQIIDAFARVRARVCAYALTLTDVFPPFHGEPGSLHSVRVHHDGPSRMSRLAVACRPFLLLPHILFGLVYGASFFALWMLMLPVQFVTGRRGRWIFDLEWEWFVYVQRVSAYALLLIDEFPPFNGVQPMITAAWFQSHTAPGHDKRGIHH